VTFSRRRYGAPNIAFEVGGIESLSGETDGAFDGAIAVDAAPFVVAPAVEGAASAAVDPRAQRIGELWRVVGTPGWMFIAQPVEGNPDGGPAQAASLRIALGDAVHPAAEATVSTGESATRPTAPVHTSVDLRDRWVYALSRRDDPEWPAAESTMPGTPSWTGRRIGRPESVMRILYDGVAFQNAHQRGIQRYFLELLARLPEQAEPVLALEAGARAPLPPRARVIRTDLGLASILPRRARTPVTRLLAPAVLRPPARRPTKFQFPT
jgi:hypothetical protein